MRAVWRATGGVSPLRGPIAGVVGLLVVEAVLPGASLLLLEGALSAASAGQADAVVGPVAGLVAVTALASGAKLLRTAVSKGVAWRLAEQLRVAAHGALLEGTLDDRTVGDRLSLLGAEIDQVQLGVSAAVTLLRNPLALAGLAAAAVWVAPTLAATTALVLGPVALLVWGSTRWVGRAAREQREARADLLGLGGEQLHGREVLVAHDALATEGARFGALARADRRARWRLDVVRGVPGMVTQILGVAALGGVLVFGVRDIGAGQLETAAVMAFAAGLFLALRPLTALAEAGSLARRARAALERVEGLLASEGQGWDASIVPVGQGLTLRGACQGDAVGPVSLDVPAGQWVVLMGATGSGKTTVLRWLAGLQIPTEGQALVGGVAPHAVSPAHRLTAYAPQDSVLFARSVADNIRLGCPEAGVEEVAAELARVAAEDLDPDQLLRPLGAPLSGGERQRLALARGLLLQRSVWLLDEPTAHLDGPTRDKVVRGLLATRAGQTVVCATHDPALAAHADRVVVLEDGRVIQDGPPQLGPRQVKA